MKVSVIGSGGWGTALALLLLENGHDVTLWSYSEAESQVLREKRENPVLKGVPLPETLRLSTDLACVRGCKVVVMATPSFAVRSTAHQLAPHLEPGTVLVSVSKGIEKDTSLCLTQVIAQEVGECYPVVALSGPSHAEEVGRRVPTAVVSASEDRAAAELVQDLFMNERFRVYASDDVIGVELGAALKNVIALCAGRADDPGADRNCPAGRGHGRPEGDGSRPGRRGRSDRHLHLHALPESACGHPHRSGHPAGAGRQGDRHGGRGLLCRRDGHDTGQ